MSGKNFKIFLLFLLLGLLAYSNSIKNNFVFSDHYLIRENYLVRSFSFIGYYFKGYLTQSVKNAFRPLSMLSYNLNFLLAGYNVSGYRIFNILIHCFNAFLLYLVILRLFPAQERRAGLIASLVYLLHPLNNSAVNYLMARSTLLLTTFHLGSFYTFIRYCEENERRYLFYSSLLYLFAFLTKENAPLYYIVLICYLIFVKKDKLGEIFVKTSPHLMITLLGLLYLKSFHLGIFASSNLPIRYSRPLLTFLSQLKILFLCLRLFIFPQGLSFDHSSYRVEVPTELAPWLFLALLLLLGIVLLKLSHKFRFSFCWLICFYSWKFFIQLESPGREYHFYLPEVGIIFFLSTLLGYIFRRKVYLHISIFCLLILGLLSYLRNPVFQNETTLSLDILKKYPDSHIANYQMALAYLEKEEYQKAIQKFEETVQISSNPQAEVKSLLNLSEIYLRLAQIENALDLAKRALKKYPYIFSPYKLLEEIYLQNPELDFEELKKELSETSFLYFAGEYYYRKGNYSQAKEYLMQALKKGWRSADVYYLLGRIEEGEGNIQQAVSYYQKALQEFPFHKEAYFYLGTILARKSNPQAVYYLKMSIRIDPFFSRGYYNLGIFHLGRGDEKRAFLYLSKAQELGYPIPAPVAQMLRE